MMPDPRLDPDYQRWLAEQAPAAGAEPEPEPAAEPAEAVQPDAEPEPGPQPMYAASLSPDDAVAATLATGHAAVGQPGLGAAVSN